MRASPPIDIELSRSGAWLAFVLSVLVAVLAVITTWLALGVRELALPPLAAIGVTALTLGLLGAGLGLTRNVEGRLRWNGLLWELDEAIPVGSRTWVGDVAVAVDLGGWLLLRFTPSADPCKATRWLRLQRRGHEAQWHALRCALYSRRPATYSS